VNLRDLWNQRKSSTLFKERDAKYLVHDTYYHSKFKGSEGNQLTYRPYQMDNINYGSDDPSYLINHCRKIVNYFASSFSKRPKWFVIPKSSQEDELKHASELTGDLEKCVRRSRLDSLQPKWSYFLSSRGDAVYGVEVVNGESYIRMYDPWWCYPSHSPFDLGACLDMLVSFNVTAYWVRQNYDVSLSNKRDEEMVQMFLYWDSKRKFVQFDDVLVGGSEHGFDRCPFRWTFGGPSGLMGESDVIEIPKLQDLYNENILLAMDSVRKDIDPAYWGSGLKGDVTPVPGQVANAGPDAKINAFPSGGNPQVILGIADMLSGSMQSMAGVSPISMTGQASGSIVTGSAVRHQVEAGESRLDTRKTFIEDTFRMLGELVLSQVETERYEVEANYGAFSSIPLQDRIQLALQGEGRLWDDAYAVGTVIDLPGVEAAEMMERIAAYQVRQATVAAQAQIAAQKLSAQSQQQQGPQMPHTGSPAVPQRPQSPVPPTAAQVGGQATISTVKQALQFVAQKVKGKVWAVGQLAQMGLAQYPMVMVSDKEDLNIVQPIMKGMHGMATLGRPQKGVPRIEII
jgi:hypothetical protein